MGIWGLACAYVPPERISLCVCQMFLGYHPGVTFFVNFSDWGLLDYSGSMNSNPDPSKGVHGYEFHDSL